MTDTPSTSNPTDKSILWANRMDAWKTSRLSQVQFCKQNNLTYAAFGYWRTRLKKLNLVNGGDAVKFLPVKFSPQSQPQRSLTLNINHQHSIDICSDFDVALLTKIIQAVQSALPIP